MKPHEQLQICMTHYQADSRTMSFLRSIAEAVRGDPVAYPTEKQACWIGVLFDRIPQGKAPGPLPSPLQLTPEQAKAVEFAVKWTWQRLGCGQKSLPPNLKKVVFTLGDMTCNFNLPDQRDDQLSLKSVD